MLNNIKNIISFTKKIKLLYVEDSETTRRQTLKLLSNFFDDITTAVDGQEGLELFKKNSFDMIITDINMPNMSGIEMLKKIKKSNTNIPCIIMSAHDDSKYFIESIRLDIDGYILKPLDIEFFSKILMKIIEKLKLKKENQYYIKKLEVLVKEKTKKLEYKLYYDELTGLNNRYSLIEEISSCKKDCISVVMMLDIDSLKTYNELYGVDSGNSILIQCAKHLKNLAKNSNFKVYRITSDEFVLFKKIKSIDIDEYKDTVNSIFDFFSKNKLYVENIQDNIEVNFTIGMAFGDKNTIAKANSALYEAKKNNKKFAIYTEDNNIKKQLKNIIYWKDEIKDALENDNIVPYFQPIVDRNQKTIKHESLIRLKQYQKDGTQKIISPFNFLEISMQTKQYDDLSYVMLEKSILCATNKKISFSINLDYRDIYNEKLVKMLKKNIVKFYDLNKDNSNKIILEILENHEIKDYESFTKQILEFKKLGALVAIDDFGSGYSNLTHIMGISPHYLKIDGSLIKNIVTNQTSRKIVKSLVQLAKNLGIKTVAEFVANKDIFDVVYDLGVDEFQGYYFSEPVSCENIVV